MEPIRSLIFKRLTTGVLSGKSNLTIGRKPIPNKASLLDLLAIALGIHHSEHAASHVCNRFEVGLGLGVH